MITASKKAAITSRATNLPIFTVFSST